MSSSTIVVNRAVRALSLVALVGTASTPAHAQLLKRIKQAAVDKVVDKTVDKAAPGAGNSATPAVPSSAASSAAPSSSSSSLVEINDDRVTSFITAMEPVLAASRSLRAERDAKKRFEAYEACHASAMLKPPATMSKAKEAEVDRVVDAVQKLAEQVTTVYASQDSVRIARLTDSMQVLTDIQQRAMYPAIEQCGKRPAAVRATVRTNYDGSIAGVAPARVPGMSPAQFGRMRERIALYLIAPDRPNDLTATERSSLDARAKDLEEITAGFRGKSLNWSTWSEVWSAWK
jgi:hypothetical protein